MPLCVHGILWGDKERWPDDGSLNYNTILQLELFCKRQGKIFFRLRHIKKLCLKYGIVVCRKSEPTRQMVLGTGNQRKEVPREGSPPMAPELPSAPSLYPTCSHIQKHPLHKSQLKYVA